MRRLPEVLTSGERGLIITHPSLFRKYRVRRLKMLLASQIILIIAGVLLIVDAALMAAKRSNPVKGWPLPCPVTLVLLGVGIVLFVIAGM